MLEGINPRGGDMYTDAIRHERGEYLSGSPIDEDGEVQKRARNHNDMEGDVTHEAVDPNGDPLEQLIAREEENN